MSKSCPSARTFIMPEKQRRPQGRGPAGGVEGLYREVAHACQTVNAAVLGIFCRAEKGLKSEGPYSAFCINRGYSDRGLLPRCPLKAHAPEGFL
jgi:hypothetical protein